MARDTLQEKGPAALTRLRGLAATLDTALRIPGTNIRFGLDPILGLVPGLGDAIGFAFGGWIILEAARLGAPPLLLGRMLGNSLFDAVTGSVPVAGTLVDIFLRPNRRNVALLEAWLERPEHTERRSRQLVWGLVLAMLAIVIGVALLGTYLVIALVRFLSAS